MRIFNRYVIREHVAPFFFAFSVIMFVFILKLMLDIMDMVISKDVNIIILAKLLWYNLAWMIALVVPMSVLVATVMAFGRMGASGEVTAMKASGLSMFRIAFPIIGISILITMFMIWFNNVVLPQSNYKATSLNAAIFLKKPMLSLKNKERQFISDIQNITIRVDSIDYQTEEMNGITLFKREKGTKQTAIRAEKGRFISSPNTSFLTLALKNGEIHQIDDKISDRYIRTQFKDFKYTIEFDSRLDTSHRASQSDRTKTSDVMRAEIDTLKAINARNLKRIESLSGEENVNKARILNFQRDIDSNNKNISKKLIEIHKKNSIPFGAIIFVLVGAPLGILVRRSGVSIGIGMSIGFFMLYYLFLIGGESAGDRMLVDPWLAMWAPNLILGPLGILLFIYATRR
ncbi:MAG: LptF/LptG family permease [Candidatus Latescibacteria bacterium]|nr:LptF/LptG family permease [Candidatus Latescibacterota bacterium]